MVMKREFGQYTIYNAEMRRIPAEHRQQVSDLLLEGWGAELDEDFLDSIYKTTAVTYVMTESGQCVFVQTVSLMERRSIEGMSQEIQDSVFVIGDVWTSENFRRNKIATEASIALLDEWLPVWVAELRQRGILPYGGKVLIRAGFENRDWEIAFAAIISDPTRKFVGDVEDSDVALMIGSRGATFCAGEFPSGPVFGLAEYLGDEPGFRHDRYTMNLIPDKWLAHQFVQQATFENGITIAADDNGQTHMRSYEWGAAAYQTALSYSELLGLEVIDLTHVSSNDTDRAMAEELKEREGRIDIMIRIAVINQYLRCWAWKI